MALDTEITKPKREPRQPAVAPEPVREARKPDRGEIILPDGRVFKRDVHTVTSGSLSPYESVAGLAPPGITYQWKRQSVAGQEDTAYLSDLQRRGWMFVPTDRHPGHVTKHEGLVLMEIPTQWLEEAAELDRRRARAERYNTKANLDLPSGFRPAAVRGLEGGRHEAAGRVDSSLAPALTRIDE
jgi:hypothetical protein